MLTVPEASRRVGRDPETIRRWIRSWSPASEEGGDAACDRRGRSRGGLCTTACPFPCRIVGRHSRPGIPSRTGWRSCTARAAAADAGHRCERGGASLRGGRRLRRVWLGSAGLPELPGGACRSSPTLVDRRGRSRASSGSPRPTTPHTLRSLACSSAGSSRSIAGSRAVRSASDSSWVRRSSESGARAPP